MNKRHGILAAALAIAGWLALFGDKSPMQDFAEPVVRKAASQAAKPRDTGTKPAAAPLQRTQDILALQPREALIGTTLENQPSTTLFNSHSWTPPPPPPPKPPPPPPPSAPPLPFAYLGKKLEDNTWEVYLARGEQTFIARAQSLIEGAYRVDAIKPPIMTFTYLPLNQVQTLTIGGID